MTTLFTVGSIAAALVIALVAWALRMGFRDLPELEQFAVKFDGEAAQDRSEHPDAHDRGDR